MSNSLLDLPIELIEKIFEFSDDQLLLDLRKVSILAKQLAEATVLNRSDAPDIKKLMMRGEVQCKISFTFEFNSEKRLRSKAFLISVINYIQVRGMEYRSDEMSATMPPTETTSFFEQFTRFMRNSRCDVFGLFPLTPEMFSRTSTFFEEKTVREIAFELKYSEQAKEHFLQLLEQFKSTYINLVLDISVFQADRFLVHLAGIVDVMTISAPVVPLEELDNDGQFDCIKRLVYKMLSSRCFYLDLSNAFHLLPFNVAKVLASSLGRIQGTDIRLILPSSEISTMRDHSSRHMVAVVKDYRRSDSAYQIQIGNLMAG